MDTYNFNGTTTVNTNNGSIDNSIIVNGDNHGNISAGQGNSLTVSNGSIDWSGLQSDVLKLYQAASKNGDEDLKATADKLNNAAAAKSESTVMSVLSSAAKSTLDFIKTLSLQVLPSLILKKFG